MSKRHTSTAFAKPARHHRSPLIAKTERVCKHFHVAYTDGFPMVGNVKGKAGGREDDEAIAALDPHYISRIFSR
jgi:hypothetical protein